METGPMAAGAALGPWGLMGGAALSFLPSLLSGLFGGKSSEQRLREQMMKILAPQNFSKLAGQYYQQNIGSPAFAQGQRDIAGGANQASNQLAQSLGARGIGTTGSAALLSSLTPSLVGSQMAGLRTGAWNAAQGQAQSNIQQQLAALQGTSGPSQTSQLFAAGMGPFGDLLQQYFRRFGGGQGLPSAGTFGNANQWGQYQTPGMANPYIRPRTP